MKGRSAQSSQFNLPYLNNSTFRIDWHKVHFLDALNKLHVFNFLNKNYSMRISGFYTCL